MGKKKQLSLSLFEGRSSAEHGEGGEGGVVSPDLDQRGSPAWSAAGRTGGAPIGPGCPFGGRRTPARGGGASARRPSLGGYLGGEESEE